MSHGRGVLGPEVHAWADGFKEILYLGLARLDHAFSFPLSSYTSSTTRC